VKYNLPDVSCSNGFYFWKIISSKQLMKLHCLVCFFDIALQVEHCDYLYTAPGRPPTTICCSYYRPPSSFPSSSRLLLLLLMLPGQPFVVITARNKPLARVGVWPCSFTPGNDDPRRKAL